MVDGAQTMTRPGEASTRRQLIVNADDFGFTAGVTDGILQGMQQGIVTSTTVMANMPYAGESVRRLLSAGGRSVGIHLNLTSGPAMRTAPGALTDQEGRFLGAGVVWRDGLLRRLPVEEMECELAAQIEKVRDLGIAISHVDGHHHIQVLPQVGPVVARLCRKYQIPAVRLPHTNGRHLSLANRIKWQLVNYLAGKVRGMFQSQGLYMTDHFVAWYGGGGDTVADLQRVLASIEPGVTEIAVHPGIDDAALAALDSYLSERRAELAALCDVAISRCIENQRIDLTNFHGLALRASFR